MKRIVPNRQSYIFALKMLRRSTRRAKAMLQYGSLKGSPVFFANGFPKSGTHLLIQVLQGFTTLGPVVDSGLPPVLTFDGATGRLRSLPTIISDLRRLRDGDIAYGHLHAHPEISAELTRQGVAAFFILRDPRDVVVSHVHYVTEMEPAHVHHAYYAHELETFDQRLRVSILGRPESATPFPDIGKRFEPYLGWLDLPEVLSLRYEDFSEHLEATLVKVLHHAMDRGFHLLIPEENALQNLEAVINPFKSPTFRSGKTGRWRDSFTEAHKEIFKRVAGDLLIQLGYEDDDRW